MEVQKVEDISNAAFMQEFYIPGIHCGDPQTEIDLPDTIPENLNLTHPLLIEYTWANWLHCKWFAGEHQRSATELFSPKMIRRIKKEK
jgi:hypothetical protein